MQENADARALSAALLAAGLAFVTDELAKFLFFVPTAAEIRFEGSWFFGLVSFVAHRNYGISFDIPLPLFFIILITIGVLAFAWFHFYKTSKPTFAMAIGLGLLTGGALGNLFDRLILGYVRDWLLLGGRSAVNLADGFVLLGIFLFLIKMKSKKNLEFRMKE